MGDFLSQTVDQLLGRVQGLFHLRFLCQPCMAALLAVRAGLMDARTGQEPYLWAILVQPAVRRDLIRRGWKDVGRVFALAYVIDAIYQALVLQWFHPVQALIVAFSLAIVPYILIRGPVARVAAPRYDAMRRLKGAHLRCL
ncbi:MAG TPA: hypothetical protein VGF59_05065 [Bryobacteraceae bacterium]|jgi:hypothetical protein